MDGRPVAVGGWSEVGDCCYRSHLGISGTGVVYVDTGFLVVSLVADSLVRGHIGALG